MFKKIILSLLLLLITNSYASFEEGKKIFIDKCSSCHKEYISFKKLKVNFFERNNQLLNLTIPTENMLAWAMMESSKKIGDPEDSEMQQVEIEEYLINYLENPNGNSSISDDYIFKFFDKKSSMKDELSEKEYVNLSLFFMNYSKNHEVSNSIYEEKLSSKYNDKKLISEVKETDKLFLVYATSKTCYFCKKMDKEVLGLKSVQKQIQKNYKFMKVDVDENSLPFDLNEVYKKMTPTFFIVSKEGKFLKQYPGSWSKEDFFEILKENVN